jgi:hypothetical protein
MRMPGFTAEASVDKGKLHYCAASTRSQERDSGGTVPASLRVIKGHYGLPTPQISVSWQPPPKDTCGPNFNGTITIKGEFWPAGQTADDFCVSISNCGAGGDSYPPINCGGSNPAEIKQSAQAKSILWPEPPREFKYTNFTITGASCFCGGRSIVTVTDKFKNVQMETVAIPCNPC